MRKFTKREVTLIAELLADMLIRIYQDEQLPEMVESFEMAGFGQASLKSDPVKLFQMLVIAAYDRRPFTTLAGGSEVIWGMRHGANSIPKVMKALSLFSPEEVEDRDIETTHGRLNSQLYFGHSLATDDDSVRFARTLHDLAHLIGGGFHARILRVSTTKDVLDVYKTLTNVHGIGDTIGAKLIKYLLREIGIGRVAPQVFPLTVVWPITNEYHVSEAVERLSVRLDTTLVPLTMGLLMSRGEPFAIDALFFLNRCRSQELDDFIEESRGMHIAPGPDSGHLPTPDARTVDPQLAQRLLVVIKEIYDGSCGITEAEIKRAGLQGVVTPAQLEASARWLYEEMGKLAADGNAGEMTAFYRNCLNSDNGKLVGWALQQLGRTSMESEVNRFMTIYEQRFS